MRIVQVLAIAIVVFLVLAVLVRIFERNLVYFPMRYPAGFWDSALLGVEAEDIEFETGDGLRLHGWWMEGKHVGREGEEVGQGGRSSPGPPVLVWFHGNAGNLTHRAPSARPLVEAGISVLLFDYRGYGRSEGRPSEEGLYRDAEAAYAYLTEARGISPARVILYGRSLGSAPAARLSVSVEHAGMILVSPFTSAKAMARRMFFGLPLGFLAASEFPVSTWVAERDRPLLVIHGDRDTVVPFKLGRQVFEAAAQPKRFVALRGAGHNDIEAVASELYFESVREFAWQCVGGRTSPSLLD